MYKPRTMKIDNSHKNRACLKPMSGRYSKIARLNKILRQQVRWIRRNHPEFFFTAVDQEG